MSGFSELPDDDFGDDIASPKDAAKIAGMQQAPVFEENCKKCRGTGQFVSYSGRMLGPCHACKGKGRLQFKTSAEQRSKARASGAATLERKGEASLARFKESHPDVFAWMDGNPFPFALAMREAIKKYGSLTDRQMAACVTSMQKLAAIKADTAARIEGAKAVDTTKIEAAFAKASTILKSPKLRVAGFVISHAKAESKNAGALYVKADGAYLGKIQGGKFIRSRECQDAQESSLLDVAADPMEAAIKYGRLTGRCACCGAELSNAESVARGIGPICAENFGWGG